MIEAQTAAAVRTSPEVSAALLTRYMDEVWNRANYGVAHELVSTDMVVHGAGGQVINQGPVGVISLVQAWRAAFPDGRMIVHDVVAGGDLVADRLTWVGTHTGDFYGIPASGREVACTSIGFDRIADGKIVEGWGELDMLGMFQQLGAAPAVLPAGPRTWQDDPDWAAEDVFTDVVEDPASGRDVVLRYFECLNSGDEDGLRDVIDEAAYVDHDPAAAGRRGFQASLRSHAALHASVPDLVLTPEPEHVIVQGEKVFVRWTASGHHEGAPLLGASASGKKVEWTGSGVFRLRAGRCQERWVCEDLLSLAKQVGAVP